MEEFGHHQMEEGGSLEVKILPQKKKAELQEAARARMLPRVVEVAVMHPALGVRTVGASG